MGLHFHLISFLRQGRAIPGPGEERWYSRMMTERCEREISDWRRRRWGQIVPGRDWYPPPYCLRPPLSSETRRRPRRWPTDLTKIKFHMLCSSRYVYIYKLHDSKELLAVPAEIRRESSWNRRKNFSTLTKVVFRVAIKNSPVAAEGMLSFRFVDPLSSSWLHPLKIQLLGKSYLWNGDLPHSFEKRLIVFAQFLSLIMGKKSLAVRTLFY